MWVSWANLGPFSSVFIQLPCPLYDPFSRKDTVWHRDDLFAAKSAILKMRQIPMLLKAGMGNGNGKTKWVIKNEKLLFCCCCCCSRLPVTNEEQLFFIDIHVLFQTRSGARRNSRNEWTDDKEKCVLQWTDQVMGSWQIMNVQGQIQEQIFAQNRGYCVSYPYFETCVKKYLRTACCFLRRMFSFECPLVRLHKQANIFFLL